LTTTVAESGAAAEEGHGRVETGTAIRRSNVGPGGFLPASWSYDHHKRVWPSVVAGRATKCKKKPRNFYELRGFFFLTRNHHNAMHGKS
jgi:hypothetical protein